MFLGTFVAVCFFLFMVMVMCVFVCMLWLLAKKEPLLLTLEESLCKDPGDISGAEQNPPKRSE